MIAVGEKNWKKLISLIVIIVVFIVLYAATNVLSQTEVPEFSQPKEIKSESGTFWYHPHKHGMKEQSFYLDGESKIYYEKITPDIIKQDESIILIHGGAHTGSCYKTTPDGRDGWAYYFAEKGFEVFIPDWPGSGRSGYVPLEKINGKLVVDGLLKLVEKIDGKIILVTHSMSGPYGWKLAELSNNKVVKVIGVAPGPMGNIQKISEIIKESDKELTINFLGREFNISLDNPFVCSEDFVNRKLIGENSKFFPRNYTKNYFSSIQTIAPYLFYERFNTKGSQLRIDDISKLKTIKFLVLTGTDDLDHPRELDEQIVTFLKDNGVNADFIYLGDIGIVGNGHMYMLEKNSTQIADVIYDWILNN